MAKAIWKGIIIAESDTFEMVEGNVYFPPNTIKDEYFVKTNTNTTCPWKGVASYYSVQVNGEINRDAAWYYPNASDQAKHIEGYVAFWKGVHVER